MTDQTDSTGASEPRARDDGLTRRWRSHGAVADLIASLTLALGDKLRAVVLYGPAARGEKTSGDSELHLLVLLADLDISLDDVLDELDRREGVSGIAEKASRTAD